MVPSSWTRRLAVGSTLAIGTGLAAVLACGGGGGGSSAPPSGGLGTPPANHVYVGDNTGYGSTMKFTPANLVVTAGTTVTWNFLDGPHSVTSGVPGTPDGAYDSGTLSTGTFTHAFPTAGTYHYYCSVHGAMMTGIVTVN